MILDILDILIISFITKTTLAEYPPFPGSNHHNESVEKLYYDAKWAVSPCNPVPGPV